MAADNSLLWGTYSMLTQGFIQAGSANAVPIEPSEVKFGESVNPRYPNSTDKVPEVSFPIREAPVIMGTPAPDPVPFGNYEGAARTIWGGYRPVASLSVVYFDGEGGVEGNVVAMLNGTPQVFPQQANEFLPRIKEIAIDKNYSGYEVDPAGNTARARIAMQFGGQIHVLLYFLTILKDADELHFLVIGATVPVIQYGSMKRSLNPDPDYRSWWRWLLPWRSR